MKSWMITRAVAAMALTGSMSAAGMADTTTVSKPAAGTDVKTASNETIKAASPRLLTLDYVNAEVTDVIRALSAQSGINVAMNPSVKGQVTVHLRGKTVDEAMVMVANLAGLGARKVSDTFVVAPRAEMRQTLERLGDKRFVSIDSMKPQDAVDLAQNAFPDLTARIQGKGVSLTGTAEDLNSAEKLLKQNDSVSPEDMHTVEKIELKHIKAAQAATALAKMEPGLSAEAAGNAVVLSGPKARVDAGKRGVELIDVQAPPNTDIRVYNVKYSTASDLASMLQSTIPSVQVSSGPESMTIVKPSFSPLTGQFAGSSSSNSSTGSSTSTQTSSGAGAPGAAGGASGSTASTSTVSRNALSLILSGAPSDIDQALKLLAMVDVPQQQVLIEAKVIETSPSLLEDIGTKWSWDPLRFLETKAGTPLSSFDTSSPVASFNNVTKNNGPGVFSRVPWSFAGVLKALVTKGDAKLLANPSVSVINDQDASVFIGDTLRFQSLAQSSPTTGNQFTVVEVPVGIVLLVHPRVNDGGTVTLRVHPVVSTITGMTNGLPQTSSREAETTVRVKDGDTIVLGGLIRDEDIRTMEKIPVLGDLPLIGSLFQHKTRDHRRTEVTVVLTIKLLKQ